MGDKKWWQSKTIWAGLIAILIAVYSTVSQQLAANCVNGTLCYNLPPIPEWVFGILAAFGIYGRAQANTTIK